MVRHSPIPVYSKTQTTVVGFGGHCTPTDSRKPAEASRYPACHDSGRHTARAKRQPFLSWLSKEWKSYSDAYRERTLQTMHTGTSHSVSSCCPKLHWAGHWGVIVHVTEVHGPNAAAQAAARGPLMLQQA